MASPHCPLPSARSPASGTSPAASANRGTDSSSAPQPARVILWFIRAIACSKKSLCDLGQGCRPQTYDRRDEGKAPAMAGATPEQVGFPIVVSVLCAHKKSPTSVEAGLFLLHGCLAVTYFRMGNPHYHRRWLVSRSCSGWEGVGPSRYGRQA